MGKPTGFMELPRVGPPKRPVDERLCDSREVYVSLPEDRLREQAARCMDCGIPFCQQGCPLGNRIPDWNDLVYRGRWRDALEELHATNNFPDFTGRLCPAPCEASCVLGLNADPVTIEQLEQSISERGWREDWIAPVRSRVRTGKRVTVIGSGPAGLACAQQLARAGHDVTVLERSDRIGGLLRYGIPDFKMDKRVLDRRLAQLEAEGVVFRTGVEAGRDVDGEKLRRDADAVVLAVGAGKPRDLPVPGRELSGVCFAMDYLEQHNRRVAGEVIEPARAIDARGKRVIILGGGDTGADCLGTAHRQGARSVLQLELMPRPPDARPDDEPWPSFPHVFRTSPAHEEGGAREWGTMTKRLVGSEGALKELHAVRVERVRDGATSTLRELPGTETVHEVDLLLLAMGFTGTDAGSLLAALGASLDERGNVRTDLQSMTDAPGVFATGDARRGQSLVVWAIAEGRATARAVDRWLRLP